MNNQFEQAVKKDFSRDEAELSLDWIKDFEVSEEQAQQFNEPDFIYQDLIISGHVVAIVAEPNAGKTTIMMDVAGELPDDYSVIYVNADVAGGDAKKMVSEAQERGFKLLLPDIAGKSMEAIVSNLVTMNEQGGDFSQYVFIFDTLKKMTDVINKSSIKETLKLCRSLSAKGMTIVLLAHTNKYKNLDGEPVFEGTGDLRSDVDELIYLIPEKHSDGSMTVSTKPDKVRGKFQPISFHISPERKVKLMESYIDTALIRQERQQTEKDATAIELITAAIDSGLIKQSEILNYCQDNGTGRRKTEAVLNRYRVGNKQGLTALWEREKAFEHNAWNYQLLKVSTPPESMYKVQTDQTVQTVQTISSKSPEKREGR